MRGRHLITALPEELQYVTTELVVALHRAALKHGDVVDKDRRRLTVRTPLQVCILATNAADQMQLSVSRNPETLLMDQAEMIFITDDGHNFMVLDVTIAPEELTVIAAMLGSDDS